VFQGNQNHCRQTSTSLWFTWAFGN